MVSQLNRVIIGGIAILGVTACASSTPSNFVYETSLRGEQGWIGAADRKSSAAALLNGGAVKDPGAALVNAFPDAEVKLRRWGLVYFRNNWKRYQVVLDADVSMADQPTVKCRMASPEKLSGAPTLPDLLANDGAEVQRRLEGLIRACAAK